MRVWVRVRADSEERQIVIYVILFAGTYTQRIRK